MNDFMTLRLRNIEENSYRHLCMLDMITSRFIITNWLLMDLLLNLAFDSVVTLSTILLTLSTYAYRHKVTVFLFSAYYVISSLLSFTD